MLNSFTVTFLNSPEQCSLQKAIVSTSWLLLPLEAEPASLMTSEGKQNSMLDHCSVIHVFLIMGLVEVCDRNAKDLGSCLIQPFTSQTPSTQLQPGTDNTRLGSCNCSWGKRRKIKVIPLLWPWQGRFFFFFGMVYRIAQTPMRQILQKYFTIGRFCDNSHGSAHARTSLDFVYFSQHTG